MPSRARSSFILAKRKAARLLDTATDRRLRPLSYSEMEPGLHAALAAYVSAWEAYVEGISLEILDEIGLASNPRLNLVLAILKTEAQTATGKFNTPNFENSRTHIYRFTGFDPYNFMFANRAGLNVQQTQTRLNEILRVRHAFAHGFSIPNLSWITRYGIQARLSKKNVRETESIVTDLVGSIDKAAAAHLNSVFGIVVNW